MQLSPLSKPWAPPQLHEESVSHCCLSTTALCSLHCTNRIRGLKLFCPPSLTSTTSVGRCVVICVQAYSTLHNVERPHRASVSDWSSDVCLFRSPIPLLKIILKNIWVASLGCIAPWWKASTRLWVWVWSLASPRKGMGWEWRALLTFNGFFF